MMNRHKINGFDDGYIAKTAGWGDGVETAAAGVKAGKDTFMAMLPYALLFPAMVGAGVGTVHSKMTSPSSTDIGTAQKALQTAEMEEFATELERRRQNDLDEKAKTDKAKETGSARTLRI